MVEPASPLSIRRTANSCRRAGRVGTTSRIQAARRNSRGCGEPTSCICSARSTGAAGRAKHYDPRDGS